LPVKSQSVSEDVPQARERRRMRLCSAKEEKELLPVRRVKLWMLRLLQVNLLLHPLREDEDVPKRYVVPHYIMPHYF